MIQEIYTSLKSSLGTQWTRGQGRAGHFSLWCRLALGYLKWVLGGRLAWLEPNRFLCQKLQLKVNYCDSY